MPSLFTRFKGKLHLHRLAHCRLTVIALRACPFHAAATSPTRRSNLNLKEENHDYFRESKTHSQIRCPGRSIGMPGATLGRSGNESFHQRKEYHAALLFSL